jgi:hypothetical protein
MLDIPEHDSVAHYLEPYKECFICKILQPWKINAYLYHLKNREHPLSQLHQLPNGPLLLPTGSTEVVFGMHTYYRMGDQEMEVKYANLITDKVLWHVLHLEHKKNKPGVQPITLPIEDWPSTMLYQQRTLLDAATYSDADLARVLTKYEDENGHGGEFLCSIYGIVKFVVRQVFNESCWAQPVREQDRAITITSPINNGEPSIATRDHLARRAKQRRRENGIPSPVQADASTDDVQHGLSTDHPICTYPLCVECFDVVLENRDKSNRLERRLGIIQCPNNDCKTKGRYKWLYRDDYVRGERHLPPTRRTRGNRPRRYQDGA